MKKILAVLAVVALLASPAMAGLTLKVSDSYGFYHTAYPTYAGHGGEFIVTPNAKISAHQLNVTGYKFETFCVEMAEYLAFDLQTPYNVDLSDRAVKGSRGGENPNYDILSGSTRWLYCEFIKGTLDTYGYHYATNTQADKDARAASANALQDAIWFYEGELGNDKTKLSAAAQVFVNAAYLKDSACTRVMNLWAKTNLGSGTPYLDPVHGQIYIYQSLLVCVPAPGAALLGVIGLGLVGWVKRRFA